MIFRAHSITFDVMYTLKEGSLMGITVHRKFSLYMIINWSTLGFKTFLKHFLGRIKNVRQQLENTAYTEKAIATPYK